MLVVLSLVFLGVLSVPFLEPGTVHQARSEFQVNLIINQNKNLFVVLGTAQDAQDKKVEKLTDYFQSALNLQPGIGLGIVVDCSKLVLDLNNSMRLCNSVPQLMLFAPSGKVIEIFNHRMLDSHKRVPTEGQISQQVLSKKIRDQIPDLIRTIEDDYDLQETLDTTQTTVISFEENLLKTPYLKKLALVFYGRIQFAVCDDKKVLQKYRSRWGNLILLQYNHSSQSYRQVDYQGDTSFESGPFEDVRNWLSGFTFPTRRRDILIDFEVKQKTHTNVSSRLMLDKLMHQDKMVVFQKDRNLTCQQLLPLLDKEEYLFIYVCYNGTDTDIEEGQLYISEARSHSFKPLVGAPEDNIHAPEIQHLISTESQMDKCIKNGQHLGKLILISYISDVHVNLLLRFVNSHPGYNSIFYICKIFVPEKFTFRKVEVKPETIAVFVPKKDLSDHQGDRFQRIEHTNVTSYFILKMFLREMSIQKLIPMFSQLSKNITQVHTPEELTQYCFSKPCVMGLIRPTGSRSKHQINLLKSMSHQFQKSFTFIWINVDCHYQVEKQLKITIDNSALVFFNQKSSRYLVFGGKYWIKSELTKWLKSLESGVPLKRLKLSLTIEPKKCLKNIYLDQL